MNQELKDKIAHLKDLAEKATPGPWADGQNVEKVLGRRNDMNQGTVYMNYKDCGPCPRVEVFYNPHEGSMQTEQDAAYIASANPDTILELIAEIEALEKEADWLAITIVEMQTHVSWINEDIKACCNQKYWREEARKAVREEK